MIQKKSTTDEPSTMTTKKNCKWKNSRETERGCRGHYLIHMVKWQEPKDAIEMGRL